MKLYNHKCKFCEIEFESRKKKQNYCCRDCYNKALKDKIPWNKGISLVDVECSYCNTIFT